MGEGGNRGGDANERMKGALSPEAKRAQEAVELGRVSHELGLMSEERVADLRSAIEESLKELSGAYQEPIDILDARTLKVEINVGLYKEALGEDRAESDPKLHAFREQLSRLREDLESRKRLAA